MFGRYCYNGLTSRSCFRLLWLTGATKDDFTGMLRSFYIDSYPGFIVFPYRRGVSAGGLDL